MKKRAKLVKESLNEQFEMGDEIKRLYDKYKKYGFEYDWNVPALYQVVETPLVPTTLMIRAKDPVEEIHATTLVVIVDDKRGEELVSVLEGEERIDETLEDDFIGKLKKFKDPKKLDAILEIYGFDE